MTRTAALNAPTTGGDAISVEPSKVFVLVHGSFHGAWTFEKLAPLLVQEGHQVIARDLPGHGLRARFPHAYLDRSQGAGGLATEPSPIAGVSLQDCADPVIADVRRVAERTPERRVIVLGHSFAGLVLSLVGEAASDLVDRLVYVSAFMNADGKTANDYLGDVEFASSGLPPLLVADPAAVGAFRIDPRSADTAYQAAFKATFAHDITDDDWAAVTHLLTPDTPAGPHDEPVQISADRWGAVPRTYVSCTADTGFPVASHHRFVREADTFTPANRTDVRELASSHSAFWSQPELLADILLDL